MTTMVCFQASGASYCIPVDNTRSVLRAEGIITLPGAGPDVAGIIPGDPPLTVIAALGNGGGQILVVESGRQVFGLQVDSVTGLRRFETALVRPAPHGQQQSLVSGTVDIGGELMMIADADALAARL